MLFKNDTGPVEVHWPTNYFFEYKLKETNTEVSALSLYATYYVAVVEWRLFRGKQLVAEGTKNIPMNERKPHHVMFMFGRRQALNHIKKWENEVNFPLEPGVVYEAKSSMMIDRDIAKSYDGN